MNIGVLELLDSCRKVFFTAKDRPNERVREAVRNDWTPHFNPRSQSAHLFIKLRLFLQQEVPAFFADSACIKEIKNFVTSQIFVLLDKLIILGSVFVRPIGDHCHSDLVGLKWFRMGNVSGFGWSNPLATILGTFS